MGSKEHGSSDHAEENNSVTEQPQGKIPGYGEMIYAMVPKAEQAQEMERYLIDPVALKDNEWSKSHEAQEIIWDDQEKILADPYTVHVRILVGPSDTGKTTIATHMARTNEMDPAFANVLKTTTNNPKQEFLGVHLSLSHGLNEISQRTGIPKRSLQEEHREQASALISKAVAVSQRLFSHHQRYTVGMYVDVVGFTQSDLGTSVVKKYANEEHVRIFAPDPNADAEDKGRRVRKYAAEHATDQDVDAKIEEEGIIPGRKFEGNAKPFVESCGNEDAWKRHWTDIYDEVTKNPAYNTIAEMFLHTQPSLEEFLSDQSLRFTVYREYLPKRLEELQAPVDGDRVMIINNDEQLEEVHIHFDRVYGEEDEKDGRKHRFPLELIDTEKDISEYRLEENRRWEYNPGKGKGLFFNDVAESANGVEEFFIVSGINLFA
jgi:hypothetical protein